MQAAQMIAGYSLGEADILRRAMGKKKKEEMDKQRERFVRGGKMNGHPPRKVEALFDLLSKFAEYGFNKSHSAAYGYLAYLTGYLKANYTVEFLAALLTSETGNTDKVVRYIGECRALGIQVLPPDVNQSDLNFTPVGSDKIRFGLGAVKNVGVGAVEAIVRARAEGGPFHTLDDFCERVDLSAVNRRVIESLIKAGAMDSLKGFRSQLFAVVEECTEAGQRAQKDKASGQTGLFGEWTGAEAAHHDRVLPAVDDWTQTQKLRGEKETIGFYVSGHPLDQSRWKVSELATHDSQTIGKAQRGEEVALCGLLTGIQKRRNKEQKPWAFMQLEDWHGATEILVFATRYELLQKEIEEDKAVFIRGKAMPEEDGTVKINVQDIIALENVRVDFPALVGIRVRLSQNGIDKAEELRKLIEAKPGNTGVRLKLERARDFSVQLDLAAKIVPDKEFKAAIERICGPDSLEVLAF